MHGMICKSLEGFVVATYGAETWARIRQAADLPFDRFEAVQVYDAELIERVMTATARDLDRRILTVMEDIGHWICTHPPLEPVRRLIRFTGATFEDLLLSLDEVDARARMAVPELELPAFRLRELGDGLYEVDSDWKMPGGCAVLTGVLRAMADDYGTLALIERKRVQCREGRWRETISVQVVEQDFHSGRAFMLGGAA